eukprot:13083-Pyramimonas_sp.AAC.1
MDLNAEYKEKYAKVKAASGVLYPSGPSDQLSRGLQLSESAIFGKFNHFCARLSKLKELMATIEQFQRLHESTVGVENIGNLSERILDTLKVYSHDGPIRRRKRRYILMTDQSDAGSAGII